MEGRHVGIRSSILVLSDEDRGFDPGSASTKDYNFVFYVFPLEIVKDRNDWLRVRIKLWSEAISKFRYAFVFSVYIQKLYIRREMQTHKLDTRTQKYTNASDTLMVSVDKRQSLSLL